MDEPASGGRGEIAPLVAALMKAGEAVRGRRGIHRRDVHAHRGRAAGIARLDRTRGNPKSGWAGRITAGAGSVGFDRKEYEFEPASGPATVQASFSEPGEYVIRMQTIRDIASFEFYCCHTNAWFHVTVGD